MIKTIYNFFLKTLVVVVFTFTMVAGFTWLGSGSIAMAQDTDLCGNNFEFTTDFRLQDCRGFKHNGANPYFILKPGYQQILEGIEEDDEGEVVLVREEVTVLYDTKLINLEGRRIKTRVVEERAFEWDEEEEEWMTIEISLNWFAICRKTNAVYYFGEWSRDCEDGFDEDDVCEGEESNEGSWEAGVG